MKSVTKLNGYIVVTTGRARHSVRAAAFSIFYLLTASFSFGQGPTNTNAIASSRAVMVTTNGVLAAPVDFFSKNSNALNAAITSIATNNVGTGLGAMALQPTNAPQFYNGTNYGNFMIISNAPGNPNSLLNFQNVGSKIVWGQGSIDGELWDNYGHGGGGNGSELQLSFNLFSFNPASAAGHVQFGLIASTAPQSFYEARCSYTSGPYASGAGNLVSDFHGWQYGWSNAATGGAHIGQLSVQTVPYDTNGTSDLIIYQPLADQDVNTIPTIRSVEIISGLGTKLWGMNILDRTNASPASTYNVNLGGQQIQEVTVPGGGLTIGFTNTAFLNTQNSVQPTVMLYPGLASPALTFSPGAAITLNWGNEAGTATAPASIPNSKMMKLELLTQITANVTNIWASYKLYPYTPVIDSDALKFFTAVGVGNLSGTESNAVNNFISSAKSHSYWANLIDWHPLVGGTSNSCSWNAVTTNKYRMAWTGSTSTNFTVNGIYGDAVGFYGDLTGLVPSTEITSANSCFCGVWIRGPAAPTDGGDFFGVVGNNSSNVRWGAGRSGAFFVMDGMNTTGNNAAVVNAGGNFVGLVAENHTSSTTQQNYLNGVSAGGTSASTTALPAAQDLVVCARGFSGFSPDRFSNVNLTSVVVGQNMTAQNVTDLNTDLSAFNATLGR